MITNQCVDKGAKSKRCRSSRPLSPLRLVTIDREISNVPLTQSEGVEWRRDISSCAAIAPSPIKTTHSLIPSRPMHSSLRVRALSSQEKRRISSADTELAFAPEYELMAVRLKVTFTTLKLACMRFETAI